MIKVIDDFLPPDAYQNFHDIIMGDMFAWYYNDSVDYVGDGNSQFIHNFYSDSSWRSDPAFIEHFESILNPLAWIRIKANMLDKTAEKFQYNWHLDSAPYRSITTAVYYVNDNNGGTVFKNGEYVESKANRIALFPCELEHCGTTATDNRRVVMNFNFIEKPDVNWVQGV